MMRRLLSFSALAAGAVGGLLGYAGVMLWPYLAATLVRDGAVTTWTNLATAPIRGRVQGRLPILDTKVPESGVIVELVNEHHDPGEALRADAAVDAASARVASAASHVDGLRDIDDFRRELRRLYAARLRQALDVEIAGREARIAALEAKVAIATARAERTRSVADSGYRSRDYHDDAELTAAQARSELAAERLGLGEAKLRRADADEGIFRAPDGSGPNWAYEQQQQSKTEIKRAQSLLREAQLVEQQAERLRDAAWQTFRLQSRAAVRAPPGAIVQSVMVGAGAVVEVGDPVAKWIDCDSLYVDAPVSDAALPLIPLGSKAELVIEGESRWRRARVVIVRGGAATIGASDLAAVAKGRKPGDGQVLLELERDGEGFSHCPVGRSAYVHFPTVGIVAILLARLRLG